MCGNVVLLFQRRSHCTGEAKISYIILQQSGTFEFIYRHAGIRKYRFPLNGWYERMVMGDEKSDEIESNTKPNHDNQYTKFYSVLIYIPPSD